MISSFQECNLLRVWNTLQLRLAEERACEFSEPDEPSNNNISPDMDPREDQAAQKEPKVVFCTFWGKIREVFSEQKKK